MSGFGVRDFWRLADPFLVIGAISAWTRLEERVPWRLSSRAPGLRSWRAPGAALCVLPALDEAWRCNRKYSFHSGDTIPPRFSRRSRCSLIRNSADFHPPRPEAASTNRHMSTFSIAIGSSHIVLHRDAKSLVLALPAQDDDEV